MTETVGSLIIEHLRPIRARVDRIGDDVTDLRQRTSSLEHAMVAVRRAVAAGDETDARQQASLDKLLARIERIERQLEIQS